MEENTPAGPPKVEIGMASLEHKNLMLKVGGEKLICILEDRRELKSFSSAQGTSAFPETTQRPLGLVRSHTMH